MATVSAAAVTRISDVEGALTLTSIGGGAGGGANTEIFIQNAQAAGRKQSNVTDHGFWLTVGTQDVSGAGVHVGLWITHIHYAVLTKLAMRMGSSTANYHEHTFPLAEYPALGGWVRLWVDVGRTAEATAGTFSKTAMVQLGVLASLPAVGGNAPNIVMDASDFTTTGLSLTGTSGLWSDFVTADEGTQNNRYGVVATRAGIIYCLARLTLGTASSLVFTDSGFTIVFPEQARVATTFMGVTVDLQNASTAVTWSGAVIQSAGTTRFGDLVVTGTAGTLTASGMAFSKLRIVTLTSACTITDSSFRACGQITAPGSDLQGTAVSGYEGTADTSALVWDVATDPNGLLDGMAFTKGTAATHAIEFGTTSPTTMTLTNMVFSGYGADASTSAALHIKRTTGTVTINITGGSTPTYKTDGAAVVFVTSVRTVKVSVVDAAGAAVTGANVFLRAAAGGPFPYQESVTIARVAALATVTHTGHGLSTNDKVLLEGITDKTEDNAVHTITRIDDNSYSYPTTNAGSTAYTGAILSTFVFLKGLANQGAGSNELSMTRAIPSTQPVTGWARKSSSAPFFKPGALAGSVLSTGDTAFSAVMISDD